MPSLLLRLGAVYSRMAEPAALVGLSLPPAFTSLRQHQLAAWQAYNDPDVDVIFDTALTGDGKSLAGQLPLLTDPANRVMLLYPTNELIRDQEGQVKTNIERFSRSYAFEPMYGERITELMEENAEKSRANQVLTLFRDRDVRLVLSNPDLFHLMNNYNYGHGYEKREFVYEVPSDFRYFVFDEFHIFGAPQMVSVMNILNYHKVAYAHRRLKYIFLSATPNQTFTTMLKNSGFRVAVIEGDYSPVPAEGYTLDPIVQPVNLHLHPMEERGAEAWAEAHLAELGDFYRANPTAKGVFIVNSVATAKRLVRFYRDNIARLGIWEVGENTGLTHKQDRVDAMANSDVGLIIATSTVDVGVDFEINLLIFESHNAGTFIQRLGRLGRHKREGWNEYRAYALLPAWQVGRFEQRKFAEGQEINRLDFLRAVRGEDVVEKERDLIFRADQQFKQYVPKWGRLQTAHLVYQAEHLDADVPQKYITDELQNKALRDQYNRMYRGTANTTDCIGGKVKEYIAKLKDTAQGKPILDELNSFRGRSPLTCAIFDETDRTFKTYALFFLIANTDFVPVDEATFRALRDRNGLPPPRSCVSYDLKLYVRLRAYLPERSGFTLANKLSFAGKANNRVQVMTAFRINDSPQLQRHENNAVNERLGVLALVCLPIKDKRATNVRAFRNLKGLNALFPLYDVRDGRDSAYIMAFGLNALLVHSLVFWQEDPDQDECNLIY